MTYSRPRTPKSKVNNQISQKKSNKIEKKLPTPKNFA